MDSDSRSYFQGKRKNGEASDGDRASDSSSNSRSGTNRAKPFHESPMSNQTHEAITKVDSECIHTLLSSTGLIDNK